MNQYKNDTSVNPALLWEMTKFKVEEKSVSYAAYKNVATEKCEEMLECEIPLLEKHLDKVNNSSSSYQISALSALSVPTALTLWKEKCMLLYTFASCVLGLFIDRGT